MENETRYNDCIYRWIIARQSWSWWLGTVVLYATGMVRELGGYAADTTNNRMELTAAHEALYFLEQENTTAKSLSVRTLRIYLMALQVGYSHGRKMVGKLKQVSELKTVTFGKRCSGLPID